MRTLKTITCVVCISTLFCCTTPEYRTDPIAKSTTSNRPSRNFLQVPNPLHFKWGLYHLYGGFAGFNEYYAYGQVTWKFDFNNQTFTVLNLTNSFPSGGYLPTGVYPCNITVYSNGTFCFSTSTLSGCFSPNSNILYLTEGKVDDGISLVLVH